MAAAGADPHRPHLYTRLAGDCFRRADADLASRYLHVSPEHGSDVRPNVPIKTGSRLGGAQGEGYFWSGIFSQQGSVKLNPGSALSIGFDYGGMSSIFDIPTSQIVFIKDPAATQPTMKLKLKCASTRTEAKQLVYYAPPRVKMESLMFVTVRDEIGRGELVFKNQAFKEAGLSPLVIGNVDFVQIRLTPKLYDEILGG